MCSAGMFEPFKVVIASIFLWFPGFLCVRFIQAQRKTLDSLADPGEERSRPPSRHQRAQQPSHHGIVEDCESDCT